MKKNINNKPRKKYRLTAIILSAAILMAAACIIYINDYYRAIDSLPAMAGNDRVQVTTADFGYIFDGPGEDTALIFYPGAKVEDIAYADLLRRTAAEGVDCFLVHMPGNLAFFGINKADEITQNYSYENWYISGHSLGGAMAAEYAASHSDKLRGIIFLAAYPASDLSGTGLAALSIYGSEDRVLNRESYENSLGSMPESFREYVIEGGNHAGFGNYGYQEGDGSADITGEEQREITAEIITEFITSEE